MATVNADRSGMGISPTSRNLKPQLSRRTAVPLPEGGGAPAPVTAYTKLVA